jgi:hypothetical protein
VFRRRGIAAILAASVAALATTGPAGAVTLKPGDILVADLNAFSGSAGGVIKVNPRTGKQTVVSSNDQPVNASSQLFDEPWSLTMTRTGRILVTSWGLEGVISVNPATGKQTLVSSNDQAVNSGDPLLSDPSGIVLLPDGTIAVSNRSAPSVVGINPATGKQTLISSNTQPVNSGSSEFLDATYGLGTDGHGALVAAARDSGGPGALVGIDRATGKQTIVSSNSQPINLGSSEFMSGPTDLEFRKGKILVSQGSPPDGVLEVDAATGKQTLVSSNAQAVNTSSDHFVYPYGIALEPGGRILIGDESAFADGLGGVIGVNRATGKQSIVSNNLLAVNTADPLFEYPDGVAVVPPKCAGQFATIVGTPGKDRLRGTRFADVIVGLGARDRILGLRGKDRLCGGKGRDLIRGGGGRDQVRGGPGRDNAVR